MVEPVVTSRFGKRPIMEVPALGVSRNGAVAIPVLHSPAVATVGNIVFPSADSPIAAPVISSTQPIVYLPGNLPPGPTVYIDPYMKYQSAPGAQLYTGQGYTYYYGPHGELVYPPPIYNSRNSYPGVANAMPNYITIQPPPVYRAPYSNFGLTNPGFNITCELDFGRIVNIDVRDSEGEFKGIPDFLRTELMRTYGKYPYTEVKIKLEGGEFHIYATHEKHRKHRRRKYYDYDSDSDYDTYYDRYGPVEEYKSDIDSFTSGVRPKNPEDKPRGIVGERGWNRYR